MHPAPLLWLALGCTGKVELARWTPVDVAAVRADLDTPTASASRFRTWLDGGADELEALRGTAEVLDGVRRTLAGRGASPEPGPRDTATTGTQVYVRVACPGTTGVVPGPDFAAGQVRVESPALDLEDLQDLLVTGDLRASLETCQVRANTLDGTIPAWFDGAGTTVVTDGRTRAVGPTLDTTFPVRLDLAEVWRMRVELPDETHLTVALDPATELATVFLADATLSCTWSSGLSCPG